MRCFDLVLQGSGYCTSLERDPEHEPDQACRLGKLRIRFERRLDIHKALLDAGGCCNLLGTPGSSGALEAPLWGRSQTFSDRSQTVLRPFSGRSLVVLGPLSRREVVRAVQSGRFDPFRLPHIVCQHRELADEDAALAVASFGRLYVQCPSLYLAIWLGTKKGRESLPALLAYEASALGRRRSLAAMEPGSFRSGEGGMGVVQVSGWR